MPARRQVWLPSVITSAPAASRRSASFGVIPTPVRGVLAVEDAERRRSSSSRSAGQAVLDGPPPGRADDVADEEELQAERRASAAGRTERDTLLPVSCV